MERRSGFATDGAVEQGGGGISTSLSLLERVRAFDPMAWTRLVDLYGPLVYRWCLRAKLQPADAADVGQEVFAAVARSISQFRREEANDSFRGWLYTITRNKVRDWVNTRERTAVVGNEPIQKLAAIPASSDEDVEKQTVDDRAYLVRRAVDIVRGDFDPTTWEAFWRCIVDGRSPDEVANELGMTRNAVYLSKTRVRKRLKEEFAELIDIENPTGGSMAGTLEESDG